MQVPHADYDIFKPMSYEKYTDRYYLTLHGWEFESDLPQPPDCVQIWERKVEQGSGFGRESEHWTLSWTKEAISKESIAELHESFPRPTKSKALSREALQAISRKLRD
jgi:hypothetical protein